MASLTYEKILACGHCGRKTTVTQSHEWTDHETAATFCLPCSCFDHSPGAPSPLTPHRVQFVVGEKMRELVVARDAVNLAAVSISCSKGHLSKDTSLQQANLTYEGSCKDCGPVPVTLRATLKRRA
jgi:hypothetical protein